MPSRVTAEERLIHQMRLDTMVETLMLRGYSRQQVITAVVKPRSAASSTDDGWPGCSDKEAAQSYTRVRREMHAKVTSTNATKRRNFRIRSLNALLQSAWEERNLQVAAQAQKLLMICEGTSEYRNELDAAPETDATDGEVAEISAFASQLSTMSAAELEAYASGTDPEDMH